MEYEIKEELPQGRKHRANPNDWEAAKRALKGNPGKWVKIAENVSASTRQQLVRGRYTAFRGEELEHFEFAVRQPEDPEIAATYRPNFSDIWGRYSE